MFSGVVNQRFSLRMLDPNEYYFDDYSVEFYNHGLDNAADKNFGTIPGTLKICSKSIVFVPSNCSEPLIKVKQKSITDIKSYEPSDIAHLTAVKIEGEILTFESSEHITIQNGISPCIHHREKKSFFFTLLYVGSERVISFLQQINRASQLHYLDHQTMIAMIAHHRQSLYPFKSMFFDDLYEKECGNFVVDMVEPLVNVPGRIVVSESRIYFQPFSNAFSVSDVLKWKLDSITQIICRTYILQEVGLELFIKENDTTSNYLFVLESVKNRNELHRFLLDNCSNDSEDSDSTNMTLKWQNGLISNYDYLMYINNLADRTFNNLSQYPVFPWIFTDYASSFLDIENPEIYRDLSKPIGALTKKRLDTLMARFDEMAEPKFMYGSHYSTPGYVTYYLMRSQPDLMLCLMGGKFDHPDRVFSGIAETWNNVTHNSADFKELIPQFYESDGSFLENRMKIPFGSKQNGDVVDDVILPPWAENPKDFIAKMRAGLESDYVSSTIHLWIDLIFGYKQRGSIAEQSLNLFHYLCYPGSVDLDSIIDPNEKMSVVTQILEFGQVPQQVFSKPHPEKRIAIPYSTLQVGENTYCCDDEHEIDEPCGLNQMTNENSLVTRRMSSSAKETGSLNSFELSDKLPVKEHVTFFYDCHETQSLLVGSASGIIYTYTLPDMTNTFSVVVCNAALMCAIDLDQTVCIGSADGKCYFISKQLGNVYQAFPAHYDTITDFQLDGPMLFSSSRDSSVKVWDILRGPSGRVKALRLVCEVDHEDRVESIAVKGPMLASCMTDCVVMLWDWDAMEILHTLDMRHNDISQVTIWNDNIVLVGNSLVYLDIQNFSEVFCKRFDSLISSYQMMPGTNSILLLESSGMVTIFDLVEGINKGKLKTENVEASQIFMKNGLLLIGNKSKLFSVYKC